MKQVAGHQGLKNPILSQNGTGHSRNYQNNLGASSKTHTESMIYNNNGSAMQMGGSFNQVMSSGIHGNMRGAQNKTMHHQGVGNQSMSNAGNAAGAVTSASGRPVTSYSGKALGKKKHNNMSDPHQSNAGGVGGGAGSYQ